MLVFRLFLILSTTNKRQRGKQKSFMVILPEHYNEFTANKLPLTLDIYALSDRNSSSDKFSEKNILTLKSKSSYFKEPIYVTVLFTNKVHEMGYRAHPLFLPSNR